MSNNNLKRLSLSSTNSNHNKPPPTTPTKQIDPNDLTVQQLKSILTENDIQLSTQKEKKSYYVDLYNKFINNNQDEKIPPYSVNVIERKRRRGKVSEAADEDENLPEEEEEQDDDEENVEEEELEDNNNGNGNKTASFNPPETKKRKSTGSVVNNTEQQQLPVEEQVFEEEEASMVIIQDNNNNGIPQQRRKMKSMGTTLPSSRNSRRESGIPTSLATNQIDANRRKTLATTTNTPRYSINPTLFDNTPVGGVGLRSPSSPRASLLSSASTIRPSEMDMPKPANSFSSFMMSIILFIVWTVVFFTIYLYFFKGRDPSVPRGTPYCNSEHGLLMTNKPQVGCLRCPENGYCIGGRLVQCNSGYTIKEAVCVKDERISNTALNYIHLVQNDLSSLLGRQFCGESVQSTRPLASIKDELRTKFMRDEEIVFTDIQKDLPEEKKQLEHVKRKVAMFDKIFDQFTHLIETSSENFELEIIKKDGIDVVKSTNPSLPPLCRIRVRAVEYKGVVATILILLVFIIIGNVIKRSNDKAKRDFEDLVRVVLTKLKNKRTEMIIEHVRDEVKEEYSDRINVDKLWDKVVNQIAEDARISEVPYQNQRAWIWAASTPVKTKQN
ncbi:hypothetical protein ABK040_015042 [Willaertia magna]